MPSAQDVSSCSCSGWKPWSSWPSSLWPTGTVRIKPSHSGEYGSFCLPAWPSDWSFPSFSISAEGSPPSRRCSVSVRSAWPASLPVPLADTLAVYPYTHRKPSAFYDAFSSTDGVHLDRFSQSELLDQSSEADYSAFDEAFLEELAAEAKYAARLHFDKNLSADEKDQVVYALKSELAEEGFKRIGWREGTEIYAKSKGKKHFQSIVQFVDFDTKDPSIRYAEGLFPTDADCLIPTGKREAPPKPAPAPSRRKQSAPSSSGTSSRASTASAASSASAGSSSAPAAPRRTASKEPTVTVTQNGDWTYTTKLYEDGHKEVTGSFFCSKCNGSGLCNICHGTGVFTISMGFTMICPHCSGLKKCIDCGGVGQTTSTTRYEKPSSSSASYSGAVPYTGSYGGGGSTGSSSSSYSSSSSTRRTCPSCNGTGKGTSTIIWETNYTGEDNSVWCSECGRSAPAHRHNHPSCPVCHGSGTVGG